MNIQLTKNKILYGMDTYFDEIANLYNNDKMPNKILLSGKKGQGKSTLAYHLINYILSIDEVNKYDKKNFTINDENKSYKLIKNSSHPNFFLIDLIPEKKNIDIAQIREMISYTNKSNFNIKPRFILIDNIEHLNINSVNALLKIVEEPNDNIFFILIHNSGKKILPTLKSRCLTFKINLTFNDAIDISNQLVNNDIFEIINYDLINYYNTPGEIVRLIDFSKEKKINLNELNLSELLKLLIDSGYYKKDKFVKTLIINFIELFFLKQYKLSKTKKSLLNIYRYFINKIHNTEKFNLDMESLFLEFRSKLLNG